MKSLRLSGSSVSGGLGKLLNSNNFIACLSPQGLWKGEAECLRKDAKLCGCERTAKEIKHGEPSASSTVRIYIT